MHEDAITEMIAECACARATWRMAPGRVKCACSRNHVAHLSLHEEKRGSHRSRANFCCRGQFRFLAATEMSTQPDETPPFTPEQHAWLLEVFGPGGSTETRDGTAHHTAPTGSNPEEGPPSQPPTFSQPATSGSGERLCRRATRGGGFGGSDCCPCWSSALGGVASRKYSEGSRGHAHALGDRLLQQHSYVWHHARRPPPQRLCFTNMYNYRHTFRYKCLLVSEFGSRRPPCRAARR